MPFAPKLVIEDRVFLKDFELIENPDQKIITIEYNESIKKATVAFIGEGVTGINPGDEIVIKMPAGLALEIEGEKFIVVQRRDIILVL